jgi:hypothetical protein
MDHNLKKNLEIKLAAELDLQLQNVQRDPPLTFENLQQVLPMFFSLFDKLNFYVLFPSLEQFF